MSKKNVEWEWKKLGDVCYTFDDGDWIESSNQSPCGIRLIQTGNIGCGIFKDKGEKARYISENTFKKLNCTEIFPGDCLISRLPNPLGRACILPDLESRMITAVDCTIVRFNKFFNSSFFLYYSQSTSYQAEIDAKATGTTRSRISRKNLAEISIPIPPLDEQERIVKVLDDAFEKIDAIKTTAETNLQNAKDLFQAKLSQFFNGNNWNAMELAEVCEVVTDFVAAGSFADLRKNVSYKSEPDYAQLVRTTDLKHNFQKKDFVYVSKAAFDYLYRVDLSKESVILPNVGVNCGEVYYIPEGSLPYDHNVLGPNAVLVRSHSSDNHYLYYCFMSDNLQFQIDDITSKMAQPKFNKTSLKKLILPIPPLPIQKQIVAKLDSLSEKVKQLESNYKQVLADCDELKKALLKQAFEGML